MVLEALAAHFGAASDDIVTAVQHVQDRQRLHELLRLAVTSPTLEAFREAMGL